ncbi:proteasome assembly chaperone family protein [Psychromicrobium xiongbiense]|uniref:proteasome assembly chaperone family protein n=1 Tax=Psychromicrobium xiongbiense TaxID=3051184 RepID=UPI0025578460|nr:PAC2 family protein [Psychromicrobium sp. YIM S02556]
MNDFDYVPFLDPESLYASNDLLLSDPQLRGLNLLMGFTGFTDAGRVVTQISSEILGQLNTEPVALFDVDQLIDYRSRRPHITFDEDHFTDYQRPSLILYRVVDGLGRPFLFLTGSEPDLQWERFTAAAIGLIERLEVNLVAWVHSIPMPVPHTRPLGVTVHGNRPELIEGMSSWKATVQLPAGIGHLLELRLTETGVNVAGYAVHVPHYLADAEYPAAAVAALEYLGAAASLMLPTDRLREAGREVERQIADQMQASADVQNVVHRLEQQYDEQAQERPVRSLLAGAGDELPDADELGAAIEAYLATREDEDAAEREDTEPSE